MASQLKPWTTKAEIDRLFAGISEFSDRARHSTRKERIAKIDALYDEILARRLDIQQAMAADFGKPAEEVDLMEVYVLKAEARYIRRNLGRWMRPKRYPPGLAMTGASTWTEPLAKGAVLIIAPWNYPLQLLFRPLMAAIAAGCSVVLKPSELTAHTADVMAEIVAKVFDEREVALVLGGVEETQHLLTKPFSHFYFTGSPQVGRLVMKAAANHLAGVTLELGGKSPVVIDRRVNMAQVAKRLSWAKLLNAGQICVAPDYIFVHEDDREAFLSEIQRVFRQLYGAHPNESNDYQRIITPHHARRIEGLISEAVAGGARLVLGGHDRPEDCYIEPTVLTDIPVGARILDEEIFGPVMPVLTYRSLDEVVSFARARPIPLTINIYSRRRRIIRRLMRDIPSGTVSINQGVVHVGHSGLPFGGLGNSGVGVSHGEAAFHSFTHQRGVYQQILPGAVELLRAPYTAFSRRLVRFVLRWL